MSHQLSDVIDAIFNHGGPASQRRGINEQLVTQIKPEQTLTSDLIS